MTQSSPPTNEIAIFAAGCFWGVEEVFRSLHGVIETSVGYTGGETNEPSYEQVCSGGTGHAEAVKIIFNPQKISYEMLLKVFFENHNPTCLNYQGPDFGSQYRSVIFYTTLAQKVLAENFKSLEQSSGKWNKPVVTEIIEAKDFFSAEDYHQKYLMKRGLGSCHI